MGFLNVTLTSFMLTGSLIFNSGVSSGGFEVAAVQTPAISLPSSTEIIEPVTPPANEESEPVINDESFPMTYKDGDCAITIYREWYEDAWCYAAHLEFDDYTRFGTACANGIYEEGQYETTSGAAERLGAVFAVNGCYSAPYLNYTVVRSGVVCNGADRNLCSPAVYSSQNGKLLNGYNTEGLSGQNVSKLVEDGLVTDTFCFGPPFLTDGVVSINSDTSRAQRTFMGTNGNPGDIWIVVSDGRYNDYESAGLTYTQCAQYMAGKGCTFGIPLDGGGSSTMVFNGTVLNWNDFYEREVVDFIYFK